MMISVLGVILALATSSRAQADIVEVTGTPFCPDGYYVVGVSIATNVIICSNDLLNPKWSQGPALGDHSQSLGYSYIPKFGGVFFCPSVNDHTYVITGIDIVHRGIICTPANDPNKAYDYLQTYDDSAATRSTIFGIHSCQNKVVVELGERRTVANQPLVGVSVSSSGDFTDDDFRCVSWLDRII
jgi:hypothetical protein